MNLHLRYYGLFHKKPFPCIKFFHFVWSMCVSLSNKCLLGSPKGEKKSCAAAPLRVSLIFLPNISVWQILSPSKLIEFLQVQIMDILTTFRGKPCYKYFRWLYDFFYFPISCDFTKKTFQYFSTSIFTVWFVVAKSRDYLDMWVGIPCCIWSSNLNHGLTLYVIVHWYFCFKKHYIWNI